MAQQTAVEWLENELKKIPFIKPQDAFEQAKAMEKDRIGYTEEQAYEIWKAGQEYWKTSGRSITFEDLIDNFKKKTILQQNL